MQKSKGKRENGPLEELQESKYGYQIIYEETMSSDLAGEGTSNQDMKGSHDIKRFELYSEGSGK